MNKYTAYLLASFWVLFSFSVSAQFVENKGQVLDMSENFVPQVEYFYGCQNTAVYFEQDRVVYSFITPEDIDESLYASNVEALDSVKENRMATYTRMDMLFHGSSPSVEITASEKIEGDLHYYLNKRNGIRDVGSFKNIVYKDLYEGIDVKFYQHASGLKYDFILSENANIEDIQLEFKGAESIALEDGNLIIHTKFRDLEESIPLSFINGDKGQEVEVNYVLDESGVLHFSTDANDYESLTIDPVLEWATYYNNISATTQALDYASSHLDASGNYFIYGQVYSAANNYPVVDPGSAYTAVYNSSSDVYIAKFDPTRALVWATYLGGSSGDNSYGSEPITSSGNTLHVVGERISTGAPFTNGGGYYDATANKVFWARFNLTTGALQHLTSLGGGYDPSVAVGSSGQVAVIMDAYDFSTPPIMARGGAYNQGTNGGFKDMYLFLTNSAYAQVWGTFLGGPASQENFMCRFDNSDNIFFIGESAWSTSSSTAANEHITTLAGAYNDNSHNGGQDVLLGKFTNSGALVWNTFYGGDISDARQGQQGGYAKLIIDPTTQQLLMFWNTTSTNLPTLNGGGGAYYKTVPTHPSFNGSGSFWNYAAYFARFTSGGALSHASYYYNSTDGDLIHDVTLGGCNKLYIVGRSDQTTLSTIALPGGFNLASGGQVNLMQMDRSTLNAEWLSHLATDDGYGPTITGRTDNPRVYAASEGYNTTSTMVDPGGGAYYNASNINGTSANFMIWQLHPTLPPTISGVTTLCSGQTTTLTASGGAGAPYNWYTSSSGGTPFNTGAAYTTPTLSSNVTYYVSSGSGLCISPRQAVTITVSPGPTAPVIGSNSPVCVGGTLNLTANNISGATYAWTGPASFSSSSEDPTRASVTAAMAGTYNCTVTVGGCTSSAATTSVTVNTPSTAPTSITGTSTICDGVSTTLTLSGGSAGTGATVEWYTGSCGGTPAGSGNSITVSPSVNTTYYVRYEGTCNNTTCASQLVTVNPVPVAPIIGSNSPVCEGTSINLTSNNISGATYSWTGPSAYTSSSEDPTLTNATLAMDGTYSCEVTVSGCTSNAATTDVSITARPVVSFSTTDEVCVGATINLTPSTGGTWASSSADATITNAGVVTGVAGGSADMTFTNTTTGCSSSSAAGTVTINALPTVTVPGTGEVCVGGNITLSPTTGGTWASSNTSNATITNGGVVTGVMAGAADMTFTNTTTGCASTAASGSVTVNALEDASFSYSAGTFCVSGTDPVATITGVTSGTFTIDLGGTIDGGTGEIDLDASGVNNYTVTYTTGGTCSNSSTASVSVTSAPDATFSYAGTPYCSNGTNPVVTFGAGASAGVFTSTAGLTIDGSTGEIDLSSSTPNTYTVSNDITASGGCAAANATTSITITAADDAAFSYGSNTYCLTGTDPIPTISGTAGGAFTSTPAGLVLNGGTGEITLSTSGTNTYDVTYTTGGTCPDNSTVQVTVTSSPTADFNYASSPYCEGSGVANVTYVGSSSAGVFSDQGATGDLVIDSGTGEINLTTSLPGTYTVENTIAAGGGCVAANATSTVTITAQDDATFDYSGVITFCESDANPVANITGTTGGGFTATPAGITINGSTGEIDLAATTAGVTYDVAYTTTGTCPDNSLVSVTINSSPTVPTAGTTAGSNTICEGGSADITASGSTGTGVTYAVFDAITGGTNLGATPLTVSPTATTTYYVESFNSNGCGNVGGRQAVTVTVNPTPSISAGNDETICPTDNVTLTATGTGTVVWSTTETTSSITVSPTVTTTYTVVLTDANTCTNSDDVVVTVVTNGGSLIAADDSFTAETGTLTNLDVLLNDTFGGNTSNIVMNPINGTGTSNLDGSIDYQSTLGFVGTDSLTYEICDITCATICDTATVIITVEKTIDFGVPGGFSPNGDNINDVFVIQGLDEYPDNSLSIFNRWGSLVYQAAPYNNDWDGTPTEGVVLMGDKVTTGTYFYVLELGSGIDPLKGSIEIKRD